MRRQGSWRTARIAKQGLFFSTGFLTVFLVVQGWLVRGVTEEMDSYEEPRIASSTHSLLYPETAPEATLDGREDTFWSDQGELKPDQRNPPYLLPYDGLYLLFDGGSTHLAGRPPRPDPLLALGIRGGAPGQAFHEYARPRKIRLSYFEQRLYEINHDYRFPDQPVFVASRDFTLEDRSTEQRLSLDFIPAPGVSKGFPDQVKERWFRLEILETYSGSGKKDTAITEIRLIRGRSGKDY